MFDKLFEKKESSGNFMDEFLDKTVNTVSELVEKPIMTKVEQHFQQSVDMITNSLEAEKNGGTLPQDLPPTEHHGMPDFEAATKRWDGLMDEIFDQKLGAWKICPSCNEAVGSDLNFCPHCGAKLPEITAAQVVCRKCGTVNRFMDGVCKNCGADPRSGSGRRNKITTEIRIEAHHTIRIFPETAC
ncbi:MAG: zinc ribbon domain-containing protein [Solobacterium sp.]|nr:zinc ribbon domain-containing protein [Solobacterium sp.]